MRTATIPPAASGVAEQVRAGERQMYQGNDSPRLQMVMGEAERPFRKISPERRAFGYPDFGSQNTQTVEVEPKGTRSPVPGDTRLNARFRTGFARERCPACRPLKLPPGVFEVLVDLCLVIQVEGHRTVDLRAPEKRKVFLNLESPRASVRPSVPWLLHAIQNVGS